MSASMKGIALSGITGLFWAVASPTSKLLGATAVDISTAVIGRMIAVALSVGAWLWLAHREQLMISKRQMAQIFLFSFLGPSCLYLGFMLSVVYLDIATALVLHYTFPVVTALGSSAVTGERPARCELLGALLVLLGVACSVLDPHWKLNTSIDIRGILWGALAVFGIAGQTLLGRACTMKRTMSNWAIFFYSHLFGIFWISVYKTLVTGWNDVVYVTPHVGGLICAQVLCTCLIGYGAYYKALEYVSAPTASLMASVEILAAVTMTSLVTQSVPTLPEIVGCCFIFSAIALVSLGHHKSS